MVLRSWMPGKVSSANILFDMHIINNRALIFSGAVILTMQALADPSSEWIHALEQRDLNSIQHLLVSDIDVNKTGSDGKTALMFASRAGQADLVNALLMAGAQVNVRNRNGGTALMYAATLEATQIPNALLRHGALLDVQADNGWTPLMVACVKGNLEVIKLLLRAGGNVNVADIYGWSPLMRAVDRNRINVVKFLLEIKEVDVNVTNDAGITALHSAAEKGYLGIAQLLMQSGADPDREDANGLTPAMVAKKSGFYEITRLLE